MTLMTVSHHSDHSNVHARGGTAPPARFLRMLEELNEMVPKLHDRRVLPRWTYVAGASFAAADGNVLEIYTRDINTYNAGFVSDQAIDVGTHVSLRLDLPDGGRFETRARIMRCREFVPGCFEGYVNFTNNLPDEFAAMIRSLSM